MPVAEFVEALKQRQLEQAAKMVEAEPELASAAVDVSGQGTTMYRSSCLPSTAVLPKSQQPSAHSASP